MFERSRKPDIDARHLIAYLFEIAGHVQTVNHLQSLNWNGTIGYLYKHVFPLYNVGTSHVFFKLSESLDFVSLADTNFSSDILRTMRDKGGSKQNYFDSDIPWHHVVYKKLFKEG